MLTRTLPLTFGACLPPQRDTPEITAREIPAERQSQYGAQGAVGTATRHSPNWDEDDSERRQRCDRPLYGDPILGNSPAWSTPSPSSFVQRPLHSTSDALANMSAVVGYTEGPPSEASGAALSNILGRLNIPSANGAPPAPTPAMSGMSEAASVSMASATMAWEAGPERDEAESVSERGGVAAFTPHGYPWLSATDARLMTPSTPPCLATHDPPQPPPPPPSVPPQPEPHPTRWIWPRRSAGAKWRPAFSNFVKLVIGGWPPPSVTPYRTRGPFPGRHPGKWPSNAVGCGCSGRLVMEGADGEREEAGGVGGCSDP